MKSIKKLDGDTMLEIGSRLRKLRKSYKLNQKELAERIGVSRKLIIDIEAGRGTSLLVLVKLLKVFNRTDHLLDGLETVSISPKEMFLKENK